MQGRKRKKIPVTAKGVYKSILSSKHLYRTEKIANYKEEILKTKLEIINIKKETAMVELNVAKQKLLTEQYIYESKIKEQ